MLKAIADDDFIRCHDANSQFTNNDSQMRWPLSSVLYCFSQNDSALSRTKTKHDVIIITRTKSHTKKCSKEYCLLQIVLKHPRTIKWKHNNFGRADKLIR